MDSPGTHHNIDLLKTAPSSTAPICIATIMLTDMQLTEQDIWPGRTALLKTGILPPLELTFNARTQELNSSHCSFPLMLASLAYLKEEKMHEPLFLLYTLLFEDRDLNAYPLPMRLPLLPALTCLP